MNYYTELPVFEKLAKHYLITERMSLGLAGLWRKWGLKYAKLKKGDQVLDLMCGDARIWPAIEEQIGNQGSLRGVDYCREMIANLPEKYRPKVSCRAFQENGLPGNSMNAVVSFFGMKTLCTSELGMLMNEVNRVLKPGGHFALMELKMPKNPMMKALVKLQLGFFKTIAAIFCPHKKDSVTHLETYMEHFGKVNYTHFYSTTTITTQTKSLFGGLLLVVHGRKL